MGWLAPGTPPSPAPRRPCPKGQHERDLLRRPPRRARCPRPCQARRLAPDVWQATYILMGLRYPIEVARRLLQGVMSMRESVTYQAIVQEGALAEARKMTLLVGERYFGQKRSAPYR